MTHKTGFLKIKLLVGISVMAGASALLLNPAMAQEKYPVDTVTLVTHSSPGGGSDVYLREMSKFLAPALGANVVVKNVKGGGSAKAVAFVAKQKPDGATFYGATPVYINVDLLTNSTYGVKDLEPVVNFFLDPPVLYVRENSPIHSLKDVIELAKANPGMQKWGTSNPAALDRMALERLKSLADIDIAVVTHEGGGDMMINVLNGSLDLGIGEVQEIRGQLEAGKLRLISTLTEKRLDEFPDVKTAKEEGLNMVVKKFRGLVGPKGLPENVIKAWEDAVPKVMADPEFQEWYKSNGLLPAFLTHAEAVPFIEDVIQEQESFFVKYGLK
ncbi:Bug family tripartite tricarboxylate transporter substrate binding protein [Pseudomonas lopnurensis]|uniref:Bug family tripartite tricarboxylate transporter substrate binding protein n=1 Tax=Pseudomonas lopnurensis TaxID=1477517 RepID=UPI0028B19311|nr:tripartite tricarboxylate transporter substrate binding protein [Pseudomonas lopnurensis]